MYTVFFQGSFSHGSNNRLAIVKRGIYLFYMSFVEFRVTQLQSIQFLRDITMNADGFVELLLNQGYIISMFALCAVLKVH